MGRFAETNLPSAQKESVDRGDSVQQESPPPALTLFEKGSFSSLNLPFSQNECRGRGDSVRQESPSPVLSVLDEGRFFPPNLPTSDQPSDGEGDSCGLTSSPSETGESTGFSAENLPAPDQKSVVEGVDSLCSHVTFDQFGNYITRMRTNVTLREQFQRFLAAALDDDAAQWRRYNRLFQEFPSLEADVIRAALIETVVLHYRDRSLIKPGGYFTSRCKAYHLHIPAHAGNLVKTYGGMTFEELVSRLNMDAAQRTSQDFSPQQSKVRHGRAYAPYSSSVRDARGQRNNRSSVQDQEHMSELEAKALEVQIKWEAPFVHVQRIRRLSHAAFVLDVSIDGVTWTFTSKEEWGRYYSELCACQSYADQQVTLQAPVGRVQAL